MSPLYCCLSSFKVTGYSGGTVIIYCDYYIEQRSNEKYFCKGPKWTYSCDKKITTLRKNTWVHSGRFSLYDVTGGNYFKVIIRQLTRQDEGTYWCGVDKPIIPDSYTKVELDVKKDDCCEMSVTETAYLGGEATIRCNYPEDHEDSIKYFCKESNDFKACVYMIAAHQTTAKARRFSVSVNSRDTFYTVTIRDLTEDDTGTYWCGVETSRTEQRYITLITQVKLLVRRSVSSTHRVSPDTGNNEGGCHGDVDYEEIKESTLRSDCDNHNLRRRQLTHKPL
ncbi:polymeric immunoglobulin receptor-like [Salvelinus alpinus]